MKKPAILIRIFVGALLLLPLFSVALVYVQRNEIVQNRGLVLPTLGNVDDFSLSEAGGKTVSLGDLRGKVWVADFVLTRCSGSCPIITHNMLQVQKSLPDREDVRLVSFSVDPEHDTPAVLADYAAKNGANRAVWWFLTGPKETMYRLVRGSFQMAVDDKDGTPDEPVAHSTRMVLVDRVGQIRGYYDGNDLESIKKLNRDLVSLLALRS